MNDMKWHQWNNRRAFKILKEEFEEEMKTFSNSTFKILNKLFKVETEPQSGTTHELETNIKNIH